MLVALRDKLMRRDLFEEFCREYVRELNRLRMEHRAKVSQGRQELTSVEREIRKLIQAIKDGVSATSIKNELFALEARQAELQQKLDAPEMPALLHPRMAEVYRAKVSGLCEALELEDTRMGCARIQSEVTKCSWPSSRRGGQTCSAGSPTATPCSGSRRRSASRP